MTHFGDGCGHKGIYTLYSEIIISYINKDGGNVSNNPEKQRLEDAKIEEKIGVIAL